MTSLLSDIPVELLADISRGECVPIIGAGFSLNALVPDGCSMPTWKQLGRELAGKMDRNCNDNPIKDISRYCRTSTLFELVKYLMERLYVDSSRPGKAHLAFADIPFANVITTNFDFLLERSYESKKRFCLPIVDEDLMPFSAPNGGTRLWKMHGDLHHPSLMVITEEHYDGFHELRRPMCREITSLLASNSLLFIGYSIEDPDFRQLWKVAKAQIGNLRRPAYAVVLDGAEDQEELYAMRDVTRFIRLNGKANDYGDLLCSFFREINVHVKRTRKGSRP